MLSAFGQRKLLSVLATAAFFGLVFVVAMLLNWIGSGPWNEWKALVHVAVLFSVLGTLYGVIVALDSTSGMSSANHRPVRTLICAVLGAAAVFVIWSWHPTNFDKVWAALGAIIGALLGWFGWRWAKYLDF
jgi:hypothetical protein